MERELDEGKLMNWFADVFNEVSEAYGDKDISKEFIAAYQQGKLWK